MSYVIAGVSGHTGAAAAEALLEQGQKVRVLVRDAAKGQAWPARGAEVAVADLSDAAALAKALAGAKGAYLLVPPNMTIPDFRAYQAEVVDAIVSAARTSGLPHVVLLSSVGAQLPEGTGPIAALHRGERLLRALPATKLTALRAGYFMENLGGSLGALGEGVLQSFLPAGAGIDMIATRDIGRLAAKLLLQGPAAPAVVELGGPAVSMNDAAAVLSRLLGKPIRVAEAPLEAVVPAFTSMGVSLQVAQLYEEMLRSITAGKLHFEGGHPREPGTTTLEQVLAPMVGKST